MTADRKKLRLIVTLLRQYDGYRGSLTLNRFESSRIRFSEIFISVVNTSGNDELDLKPRLYSCRVTNPVELAKFSQAQAFCKRAEGEWSSFSSLRTSDLDLDRKRVRDASSASEPLVNSVLNPFHSGSSNDLHSPIILDHFSMISRCRPGRPRATRTRYCHPACTT